ncbi:MAG: hypothetical protein HY681_14435 [Chloroflexi bacterium]|nr:hypothetical protein [Chloroflexota bacterium]
MFTMRHRPSRASRRGRLSAARSAVILALAGGMAGLLVLASGTTEVLPVGQETAQLSGETYIVLNPAVGTAASCGCENGALRLAIPESSLVFSQPSLAVGTTVMGSIARGAFVCALGQNQQGAWQVKVPGNCEQTGWALANTFQTVRVVLADGSGQATGTLVAMLTSQAPTPMHAATPAPSPTPAPTSTPAPASPIPPSGSDVSFGAGVVASPSLTVQMVQVVGSTTSGIGIVGDGGSTFMVGVETQVGSNFQIKLALKNAGDSALNGALQVQLPTGVTASASAADQVAGIAKVAPDRWVFVMNTGAANVVADITLTFRVGSSAPPGSMTLRGMLGQIAG